MASHILDPAILDALPKGHKVLAVERGSIVSEWASVARVNAQSLDGNFVSFFLKILTTPDADERVLGEFMAMREIYTTMNTIAPRPLAYGKCQEMDAHFLLCEFLNIKHGLPDPAKLGVKLAEMHHRSVSPTGKFGFHCKTFDGKLPLNTKWEASWTIFFTTLLHDVYELDVAANGQWDELDAVMQVTLRELIPRLLDQLTASGRTIKPTLIHGDLWETNIGTIDGTDDIFIFDACSYYAHHEKEVAIWRCEHHQMAAAEYRDEYFRNYEPSEPVEEYDDRNRLYSVETLLINSAHFPGSTTRQRAVDELAFLIGKYFPGKLG